jgi:outer membrane receptor protein involved in Fe transport
VTISGDKKETEYTLDKKVVNVEKNLAAMGGTAVDVLQNIPSVTVDFDGAISLRGNSNITLLIDGRPSGVTGAKLEQIPASAIESVEVITNPSARYNPEGMSGIINIKLRKKRELGFNGLVSANAGTGDKYNGSLNLNYNKKFINIFGSYDIRTGNRNGGSESVRNSFFADTAWSNLGNSDSKRKDLSNSYKLGVDFTINPMNVITLSWYFSKGGDDNNEFSNNYRYDKLNALNSYYTINEVGDYKRTSNDFILAYKRTFEKKGQEFTLDATYSMSEDDESQDIFRRDYLGDYTLDSIINQYSKTLNNRGNGNVQANYVHPLTKDIRLEGGYQGIYRNTDDDYNYGSIDEAGLFIKDTTTSNQFIYTENIHAAYAIFGMTKEKYSMQIGLRLERADTKSDQRTQDTIFKNDYISLFPTVHLNRKFAHDQEMQLSYSRRINRPNMWSLNPFRDVSDPDFVRYGNPYLKPEYINAYELGYSKYFKKSTINASLFYRRINDVIKRYAFYDADTIMNLTSKNLSYGESYGTEIILDQEIFKWWKASLNFSYFRNIIKGSKEDATLSNDNYSWTSRLNSTIVMPYRTFFQLNANYRGPMVNPGGEMAAMFTMDIALKTDIIKDKLTANFRLSDVFKTQKFKNKSSGVGFTSEYERWRDSRVAFIGLTWKIGGDIKQKQRKRSDQNGGGGEEEF